MEFTVKTTLPVSADKVYDTWLNSAGHSLMTGAKAKITRTVGDNFLVWDGYIKGINLELDPKKRILQSWRTTEFKKDQDDSVVEINLVDVSGGCEITLHHSHLSEVDSKYKQGWEDHYFTPMKEYFESL